MTTTVPATASTLELAPLRRRPLTRGAPAGVTIRVARLTKRHRGGKIALDDVSLTVEPGELTAVIGPSGAGKSTLLKALAGITTVETGAICLEGPPPAGLDAGIGFVPQDDILHGELPLRRTLRYAAQLRLDAPATVIDAVVDEAL